ncbi:ModE family transcriptional regulator [Lysobacteraceae bacterium NML93-0399]|nr:ModE family transcriptional regulator [Xanthomonadaceae bacterium NML93-0399]
MADLRDFQLRIRLGEVMLGPGKAELLEGIRDTGSISAAGRRMSMSYRRAWQLVEQLNLYFGAPVVSTLTGGRGGGGAELTPLGEEIAATYRRMQQQCANAMAEDLARLHGLAKPSRPETP